MRKISTFWAALLVLCATAIITEARDKGGDNNTQRKAAGVYDMQKSTAGNVELYHTNYGILGFEPQKNTGGGYWPRGSQNQYIYGSGLWFGAQKQSPDGTGLKNYVEIGYNPNNGLSWFVPGMVADGEKASEDLKDKYRLYFSTDFNEDNGAPIYAEDGPNWPLWISDTAKKYHYGAYKHDYVGDIAERNTAAYPLGPLYVSDEDILSIYKDTDLEKYEGGAAKRKAQGYPLGLEIRTNVYSWDKEDMKDIVIVSQMIKNTSQETLYNCWAAGFYDIDLVYTPSGPIGASNDRAKFFTEDESLNLGVAWTETTQGEDGRNFGYIGISILESPAVDGSGFIRNDKLIYDPDEQLGLKTFSTYNIAEDILGDDERYNYMSKMTKDEDTGPSDKRMFLATGPFNMKPGDVARVTFAINFAMPAKGGEADGTLEDIEGLKGKAYNSGNAPQSQEYNNSLTGALKLAKDRYYNVILPTIVQNDNYNKANIDIYPNPAGDYIYIRNFPESNYGSDYYIYSIEGIIAGSGKTASRIDISSLPAGFYQFRSGQLRINFIKM